MAIVVLVGRWRELGFEWEEFKATFRNVHWLWMAASAAFALVTYVGRALRWRVLIRGLKPDASLWRLTSATAIGFTAIVLFGRAGELVRPYLISVREKLPFSSQVAVWLVERIYDLLMALLIFGFALSRVQSSGVRVGPNLEWVLRVGGLAAGAVGLLALALLIAFSRYAAAMERRLVDALQFLPKDPLTKLTRMVAAFRQAMESAGNRSFVYLISVYSLLEWALIIACYGCLFRAFPSTASFHLTDVIIFVGFVAFGAIVQIPGVGGGLQVASVVMLTELFGLGLERSSGIALMIWLVTFVVVVPLGLLLAFHEGVNWRKLKGIEDEAQL